MDLVWNHGNSATKVWRILAGTQYLPLWLVVHI